MVPVAILAQDLQPLFASTMTSWLGDLVACRLNISGCNVTISVDAAGGDVLQDQVATAIDQQSGEFALLVIEALRAGTPGLAEVQPPAAAKAPSAGAGVPSPPPPLGAASATWGRRETPPPPPPRAAAATGAAPGAAGSPKAPPPKTPGPGVPAAREAAMPRGTGLVQAQEDRDWAVRLAAATAHGTVVAAALRTGGAVPKAPPMPPPLRNRVWAAVGGDPALAGLYARWDGGAAAAADHLPPCVVRGWASLAEARAFAEGAGSELPDRRF